MGLPRKREGMSTQIFDSTDRNGVGLYLTAFWDGETMGRAIRITLGGGDYAQLSEQEVRQLVAVLQFWLNKPIEEAKP